MKPPLPNLPQGRIVTACLVGVILSSTPVVLSTFGLFLLPIAREFGWPRAAVSGALFPYCAMAACVIPFVGWLCDRFGSRRVIVPGIAALGCAIAALSLAPRDLAVFYLLFGLVGAVGAAPSTMTFSRVISGWFDARRGFMLGLTAGIGNGAGASVMPFVALALMRGWGWRAAFVGLGACVLLVSLPTALLLLRDPQPRPGTAAAERFAPGALTLGEAVRTRVYWVILVVVALGAGCLTAIISHIVPMLSGRHVSTTFAVSVMSTLALTCAVWQVCMGWLMDRTRSPRLMAPLFAVAVLGVGCLQSADLAVVVFGGMCVGIGMGTEYGALPYIISRYFGLRAFGRIAGTMYSAVILAQGVTPMLMDAVYDRTGSYRLALVAITVLLAVGACLLGVLRPYGRLEAAAPEAAAGAALEAA